MDAVAAPSRQAVCIIAIVLLFAVCSLSAAAQEQKPNLEIANEYIRIIINTLEENMGRFSVGTTGGDPDRIGDENQHLIYGGEEPWTSYTTVRIGNQNWVYGNPTNRRAGKNGLYGQVVQPPTIIDDKLVSSWQLGPILVTQILSFTRSITSGLMDTAKIEYHLENTDVVSHMVGLRLVLDTMLGQNDGAPFRLTDRAVLTDTVFYSHEMPAFWQAFDSLSNPQVISQGTLAGGEVTPPNRVYFSNWGSIVDGLWDFNYQPGRDFMRAGEFELDSAIALYWDQQPLRPNESRTYVAYYGLGGVTITPGELSVALTAPWQVKADQRHRETFTIVAYIENTGEGEARDVTATLRLPEGLELLNAGDSLQRRYGNLAVGETYQTSWQVIPNGAVSGDVSFEVLVEATNSESSLAKRSVQIVKPDYLEIDLIGPLFLSVENERLSPLPMEVMAKVTNTGGATAYNVEAVLHHPLIRLARGDVPVKRLGSIAPNDAVTVTWYLDPTGISGQLVYYLDVISDTDRYASNRNEVFIPYIEPKVFVGEPQTSQGRVAAGQYFSISVWATNIPDFRKAVLEVNYDPQYLEIVGRSLDITRGTLFVDPDPEQSLLHKWDIPLVDNLRGVVSGISGDRGSMQSSDSAFGTLITIHFRAKKSGITRIGLSNVAVFDSKLIPIDVRVIDRDIVIE
ncbi:MAG TPA: cohesin domain-containing protein [Limnochordia bacterium]|nr:cohesin domain-containing protein [Limnochordia bacterium]